MRERFPSRHALLALLLLGTIIAYIDRINIAATSSAVASDLGVARIEMGIVFAAFMAGYASLQFVGGVLADCWSAKRTLAIAFVGFSLFTLITPFIGTTMPGLLLARFGV